MSVKHWVLSWVVLWAALHGLVYAEDVQPTPLEVFEQRIVPIFRSPKPSSCVQCHLSSVDLKDYILPSSEATFRSLCQHDLIDVESPEKSKILKLISMGEQDPDKGASLIHARTRKAEYDAFAAWIFACCSDPTLRAAKPDGSDRGIGPEAPLAVVRYNRKDRLLDSFVRNIWSQRMRCFPCHTPNELDTSKSHHPNPRERYEEYVEQYGQKMNLFLATPEETLRTWIVNSRKSRANHLPLLNVETPESSLLVLKPVSKVPPKDVDGKLAIASSVVPVTHGGGIKMHVNDPSYKSFMAWISDFSRVMKDGYKLESELPPDNWYATEHVLRIKDTPPGWPSMSTVQLFVFAWDADASDWSPRPIAFTQSLVTPRNVLNGSLFLLASDEQKKSWEPEGQKLAAGNYLIRACVDRQNELAENPSKLLDWTNAAGSVEIDASWKEGFQNAEILDGSLFKT